MVHSADPVDSVLQQDVRVDRITEELLGVLRFWQGLCRSLGEHARVVVAAGLHRVVDSDVRAQQRVCLLNGDLKRWMRRTMLTYMMTRQCRCATESDSATWSRSAAVAWRRPMFECTISGQSTRMML